jgi:hypothetical protein
MTRDEYERRKGRLEEQLRAGIELMESAYRAQVRALDLVWMVQAEEETALPASGHAAPAPAKQPPLPPPVQPRRRRASEVEADVYDAFERLPETFTRREVCDAVGYEPDRGALYRVLQNLTQFGVLRIESHGGGQRASVYRKTGMALFPEEG